MRSKLFASTLAIALGLVTPVINAIVFPDGVVAQTLREKKQEADRLFRQGIQQYQANQLESALESWQKALVVYRELKDRKGEGYTLGNMGLAYHSLRNYIKAIEYTQQVLAISRELKDRQSEGEALGNLGMAYLYLNQYTKTIEYLQQRLTLNREIHDRQGEMRSLLTLSELYVALKDKAKAIELSQQALVLAKELKSPELEKAALQILEKARKIVDRSLQISPRKAEGDRLLQQGSQQIQSTQVAAALRSWQQALAIYQELKDLLSQAKVLSNLEATYYSLSNYIKAIEYGQQLLMITRELKDRQNEGAVLSNLGVAYLDVGNATKAIEYQQQSLAIARELKDRKGEGRSLGNLGTAYQALGNYAKAIEYAQQRLVIARELKDRQGEGKALGNLGHAYQYLGSYAEAIEYAQQWLEIAREIKDRQSEGKALGNLGVISAFQGNHAKAIEYQEQRLEIVREIKDRQGEGEALGNLGISYDKLGNYVKSIAYAQQALGIAREIKDHQSESRAMGNLGNSYDKLGNYAAAIAYHHQQLAIASEIKDLDGMTISLNNIAAALKIQNQTYLAIAFYKQSVNVAESLRADLRKLPREIQERYTSTVSGPYRNLADLLLLQGRTREAQAILELLKVQESQTYDEQQKMPSLQIPLHPLETQTWQQVEQQAIALSPLAPLDDALKYNRDRISKEMNQSNLSIGNPSTLLNANPNTLLIQNLVVGDKLWIIWTNAKGEVKTIALDVKQQQLSETVDRLRKALGNPNSNLNDLKATSQQLYNWLIPPPLQTELAQNPKTQLLFSLDHVTRYIPIAALYDGQQYLIQKHTISNLITTDTDMGDRLAPNGQTPNILALGTSKALAGFSALPNVEAELQAIVRTKNVQGNPGGIYPGTLHLNEAFTANSLRTREPHRILHIATHGSFNPKTITASFLLLGNGDKLPITDIATLTNLSDKHLVVLSACETGISGSTSDGTEISGISSYFLRRGAKSVIASLWAVNDASTSLLMQQFYQHTAAGLTKAQALQTAQQDFLSGKLTAKDAPQRATVVAVTGNGDRPLNTPPNFSHPYYWAPFFLTGNSL